MMLERSILALAAAALLLLPGQADAELFKRLRRDYHRNNAWPEPFLGPDRMAARAPFAVMINNGWRTQNTLSDEHFDAETGALNEAGELKVRDIFSCSPPQHRTVFVLQAHDDELTAARNRSVRQFTDRIHGYAVGPAVAGTKLRPRGWPADYIHTVHSRYSQTTPDPRLPAASSGGGMSGGGGAGGGGGY